MPTAILTPRVNNNDDFVRFSRTYVEPGSVVRKGDVIADIDTDKASVTIEAPDDGFLLKFVQSPGEMIPVGAILAWLGASLDEQLPEAAAAPAVASSGGTAGEPTLKASLLLARLGFTAAEVPASGERLTAQDVLAYAERRKGHSALESRARHAPEPDAVLPEGHRVLLDVAERGMLRTVSWHRDTAVAGYVEVEYETEPWDRFAADFQQQHQLLMSPLLPLMAYRLVELARATPKINSTIVGDSRHEYSAVNLGFTLQTGTKLSLLSVRDAQRMNTKEFVDALALVMRRGMKGKLSGPETSEMTISFSSMARWQVRRHVPVLPPYTSLIVAHTHGEGGRAALGASYDHRVLTGGEVALILRAMARPAGPDELATDDK